MRLPGGVIGNTRAFDALIPGSSPGRVSVIGKLKIDGNSRNDFIS